MSEGVNRPPGWAIRFLRWFCKPYYAEMIEGDLWEIYEREQETNPGKARRRFVWNTFRFFRWRYIKHADEFVPKSSIGMFGNHLKISLRNLVKYRIYSFINLVGLSVGIGSILLITVYLINELSYDRLYPDKENTYYVANGVQGKWTPARLGVTLVDEYPDILSATRIISWGTFVGEINDEMVNLEGGLMVDSTFFDVFPQEFIVGDPATALTEPGSLVLTEELANTFFKDRNPMGERLVFEDEDFTVTGIVKNPPQTTTIPFRFLMDFPRVREVIIGNWTGNGFQTYVKIAPNADPGVIESRFIDFVRRHFAEDMEQMNTSVDEYINQRLDAGNKLFSLIPFQKIHLYYPGLSLGAGGKMSNVIIIALIGILILLIASINYINMTTARATVRLREVGMRKVLGATHNQLVGQFFIESALLTGIATLMGVILAVLVLPFFSDIVTRNFVWTDLFSTQSAGVLLLTFGVVSILSGLYPAFYIAHFQPVDALRGIGTGLRKFSFRKLLVIFQFAVSIFLIATTFIISAQVRLMQETDPGINTTQTYAINHSQTMGNDRQAFIEALKRRAGIRAVTTTTMVPSQTYIPDWNYRTIEDVPRTFAPDHVFADEHFMAVFDLELLEGRYFKEDLNDSLNVVISETFAKAIGGDVLGTRLTRGPGRNFTVIGVFKDFHPGSVKRQIRPMIIRKTSNAFWGDYIVVRMEGNMIEQADYIQTTWESMKDDYPFEGQFLSDSFARLYDTEIRFGKMFVAFALLAILIASLGLLSLSAFILEKRYKEIAVRKVLGASSFTITRLINMEFVKIILFGSLVSIPVAFYYCQTWLRQFPIRTTIEWSLLILPVVLVLLFAVIMISVQSLRVTLDNPVNALKQE